MNREGHIVIKLIIGLLVLAVIFLILLPYIKHVMHDVRKTSCNKSAQLIMEAAEKKYLSNLTPQLYIYKDGVESNESGASLNYRGKKPTSGILIVESYTEVGFALHDGIFCTKKDTFSSKIITEEIPLGKCKAYRYINKSSINDILDDTDVELEVILKTNKETDSKKILEKILMPIYADGKY